jgi:phosphotriesterase-related protein
MTIVNSVLGPLDTQDLGFTLMHEHIMISAAGVFQDYPELLEDNPVGRVTTALKKAKEGGVDTIVDATTLDLGRNIQLLVEASRQSGINIIACTGWYLDIPRFFVGLSADQLARVFIRDIEEGIGGTNVKAGVLKAASDMDGVKPQEEIILRAVARAHLRTDVPIMLHSYPQDRVGQKQVAILQEEGVDLNRVKIDHCNDTTDLEYLLWLLGRGCYIGLDRYPGRNVSPLARTTTMKALMDQGYVHRLCPSHDYVTLRIMAPYRGITPEERAKLNPHGYLYIKNAVFPQLREMGVSEESLSSLCIDGPRNFFEGAS